MSTRENLNRIRRPAFIAAISGFVLAFGAVALNHGRMPPVGVFGFVVFGCGTLLLLFSGRCLQCHRRLGQMFSQHPATRPWRISPELRFCPYCGHSMDEPLLASAGADEASKR